MDKSGMLDKVCQSKLVSRCLSNTVGRLSGLNLFLPMYHTLMAAEELPHIAHLYQPQTVDQFHHDLQRWLKVYEPLSLEDMEAVAAGQKTITRPSMFLTFDDGLREIYEHALPILSKLGVPSAVFVNSDFVDNQDLFFRYKASLLVNRIETTSHDQRVLCDALHIVSSNDKGNLDFPPDHYESTDCYVLRQQLVKVILSIKYEEKQRLSSVAELLGVDIEHFLAQQKPYMTTAQLIKAKQQGMAIGAHSIDHPLYRDLSSEEQLRQTKTCVDFVCDTYGINQSSFAFPFSDSGVSKTQMMELLSIENLSLVFGGQGFKSDIDSRIFQRHSMETGSPSTDATIARHQLVGFIRKISGRTDVIRHE